MKKMNHLILLSAICLAAVFTSCKKSSSDAYTCATCTTAPEALAANNTSSKGIYKGVFIGSTGTIKFDIMNNGSTITAEMVIDGVTVNLTSSVAWVSGQPYIAPFTGTLNGSAVTINFAVDNSGNSPTIVSSSIPGHPSVEFSLVKETSVALVEAFVGTYKTTKPETGTFNILLSRVLGKWGGVSRKDGSSTNEEVDGTIDGSGNLTESGGGVIGKLTGDNIAGSFLDGDGKTVTIEGKRKL